MTKIFFHQFLAQKFHIFNIFPFFRPTNLSQFLKALRTRSQLLQQLFILGT
jgi:hypothetical protein